MENNLVYDGGTQEQDLHEIFVMAPKCLPTRFLLFPSQLVWAVFFLTLLNYGSAQSFRRIDLKLLGDILR